MPYRGEEPGWSELSIHDEKAGSGTRAHPDAAPPPSRLGQARPDPARQRDRRLGSEAGGSAARAGSQSGLREHQLVPFSPARWRGTGGTANHRPIHSRKMGRVPKRKMIGNDLLGGRRLIFYTCIAGMSVHPCRVVHKRAITY